MAARNSAGRGGSATTTNSRSGGGSRIAESDISRLTVNDIRGQLRKRGIPGIWALRKPELVKRLANAMRAESRRGGTAKTAPAKARPARKSAAKRATAPVSRAAATPAKRATAPAKRATAPAKRAAAPAAKRAGGAAAKRASGAAARSGGTAKQAGGGARTGRSGPRTLKYAQEITSPQDRPERPGRSLITTHHEVIRRWAKERGGQPATIEGTERGSRPGVLTFDFPGWRSGGRLRQVPWADWFRTFDSRRLNFIYQEQRSDGRQSNFFRLESPDREDA